MSRPFLSQSAARRLSRQSSRLFSTSRPATRFSACSVGEATLDRRTPTSAKQTSPCHPLIRRASVRPPFSYQQAAPFSSSAACSATKVLQNPRTGDEGEPLMISISPRAVELRDHLYQSGLVLSTYDHRVWRTGLPVRSAVLKPHAGQLVLWWRLREITDPSSSPSATKEENPYNHLRITVTSGGCHGFQYIMSLESAAKIDPEEDTVFEGEAEGAEADARGEAKVVLDEPSLELLSGSTVDYTTELIGSQFKIVDNPRASSNCGCGTSFDVMG
ncbi:hypothetical protein N7468_005836 [Penicillium chermesinum]|uniref:Core domain-containing protein n=1 Tax=Penicillium chermesinum TaxID=63820 RepID=A0A9W9P067_9EURO|nr:uncharacterized protein N7468_005836 [Penicillium chermesinum]KAJ5232880.1 hypothetical protein N7468_005836 [Penicillium chermesinum]